MINKIKLFIKNDTYEYGFSKKYIYYQDIVKIAEKHNLDESLLNEEIKKENNIFIKFQIQVYLKEFKEYLFNRRLEIDDDERQNLKLKYNKNYFNFYKKLNFDELIDIRAFLINIFIDNGDLKEYNNLLQLGFVSDNKKKSLEIEYVNSDYYSNEAIFDKFINDLNSYIIDLQMNNLLKRFNSELDSCENIITKNMRLKLKSKYCFDYFNFYDELNFDKLIDNHNLSFIEIEGQIILDEFNSFLYSYFNFIDDDCILRLKSKYNKDYSNYFDDFDFERKIEKHNKTIGPKIIKNVLTSHEGVISESKCLELKSKYKEINWEYYIRKYNNALRNVHVDFESNFLIKNSERKFDGSNIEELNRTTRGINFLNYYVKYSYRNEYPEYKKFSQCVWDYKQNDEYLIDYFTEKLIEAIVYISNNYFNENIDSIALVSIPPSKVYKNSRSPMRKTINLIRKAYEKDLINCKKQILDYSNLLFRFSDVKSAHECAPFDRPKKEDHIDSILCTKSNFASDNVAYILMDDITTKATIMNACREILIDAGVNRNNVYGLAIAETMWVY